MTSKEFKLIKEMLHKQAELDKSIMSAYGLTEIDEENLRMAILDEVGELTHEFKGNWCWWKKTQAPVDRKKVLGELVDIWHFVLNWQNHFKDGEEGMINAREVVRNSKRILNLIKTKEYRLSEELSDLVAWELCKLERLIAITEYLGFTIEQVYEAYCEKNKINYQRLKEGY
jgi:dimeric dUTPase (all-alpha-NTP-PPase superfamily)|nr:MAG TPA: dUTPase [Caudoviricetes sp.]